MNTEKQVERAARRAKLIAILNNADKPLVLREIIEQAGIPVTQKHSAELLLMRMAKNGQVQKSAVGRHRYYGRLGMSMIGETAIVAKEPSQPAVKPAKPQETGDTVRRTITVDIVKATGRIRVTHNSMTIDFGITNT
jgi:hypothetical protein